MVSSSEKKRAEEDLKELDKKNKITKDMVSPLLLNSLSHTLLSLL